MVRRAPLRLQLHRARMWSRRQNRPILILPSLMMLPTLLILPSLMILLQPSMDNNAYIVAEATTTTIIISVASWLKKRLRRCRTGGSPLCCQLFRRSSQAVNGEGGP